MSYFGGGGLTHCLSALGEKAINLVPSPAAAIGMLHFLQYIIAVVMQERQPISFMFNPPFFMAGFCSTMPDENEEKQKCSKDAKGNGG
ncbi:hypothetical protein FCULG_00011650 [Fusarium culmorum]|uniref:Uncharacterized protein n=1 Tax=Fusarium culmorum TaxID=5516 RepID=A0A2T4H568_FUSCU|nr:hypothetical protein FCULG_00011650 [Fusarium culmorum]